MLHTSPLVSVIVPAYNVRRFIRRSLASLLAQTYPHLEVIVVDDGSTDGTADAVRELADPRIVYVRQDNLGIGAARNSGIRASRGEYVTLLDADDVYLPEKVRKQVTFLEQHPEYAAVYCNAINYFSRNPRRLYRNRVPHPSGEIFRELLSSSFINPNTIMIRRSVLLAGFMFPEGGRGRYAEDYDLFLRMARAGHLFGYIDEDLVVVEVRPGSNTTWEVEPIIKRNVLLVVEEMLGTLSDAERVSLGSRGILRRLRLKLAVACVAAGDREAFNDALANGVSGFTAAVVRIGVRMVPMRALRVVARVAWRLRQRRRSIAPRLDTLTTSLLGRMLLR